MVCGVCTYYTGDAERQLNTSTALFYLRREETTLAKKIFLCYTVSAVPGIRLYGMCPCIYYTGDAERQLSISTAFFEVKNKKIKIFLFFFTKVLAMRQSLCYNTNSTDT